MMTAVVPEYQTLMRRFETLAATRLPWERSWQELAEYVLPRRGDQYGHGMSGPHRSARLFDSTAIEANELLAAGLHAMLTSPATPWFELVVKDEDLARIQEVRLWLDDAARRMHAALNASNFQTEIHELYLDLGCFGTAAMSIESDPRQMLRFSTRPLSEIYFAEDACGRTDTVFRKFTLTPAQLKERWGEACGQRILTQAKRGDDDAITVLHAVFPRDAMASGWIRGHAGMAYASVYLLPDERRILHRGGFNELPYVIPRWSKVAGDVMGRSPAMKALADIKMLNEICKTTIKAAQKVVDPPLLVADDGVMLPVRTTPASLNYARFLADGTDPIRPLRTSSDVGLGLRMEESRRAAIRSAFFVNQLQLAGNAQMTATEVLQRTEEKLRLLGPMLGRLQSELLLPVIERVYGLMTRGGGLPPPPPVLSLSEIDVVYVSPLARAQRQTEAQGFLRLMQSLDPLIAVQPDVVDAIDGDAVLRHLAGLFAIPHALLREDRSVLAMRLAREQEQALAESKDDAERLAQGLARLGVRLDAPLDGVAAGAGDGS